MIEISTYTIRRPRVGLSIGKKIVCHVISVFVLRKYLLFPEKKQIGS